MLGNAIIVTRNNTPIPSSTSCTLEVNQEAVEYTPLPGSVSEDEAGWKHFRRGNYSWSLNNDSFMTDDSSNIVELIGEKENVKFMLSEKICLAGNGILKSIRIVANVNDLSRLSISIEGDNLPTLESEEL